MENYRSIYGAFNSEGTLVLYMFDRHVNSETFILVLENGLIPSIHLHQSNDFMVVQDSSPVHKANNTTRWFEDKNLRDRIIPWPARSPDLNPIKNIWNLMKLQVYRNKPNNVTELKECILNAWINISSDTTIKLVESMPRRIRSVLNRKGNPIQY